ncbi:MAG: hypothetical protein K9G01_05075 [Candidatus Planktophila sp.]|nr:hypothetical protein [Candidatus Planktophila sp.]
MKRVFFSMLLASIFALTTGCSSGPLSAEDLAARETDSDASLWDEEDYKTIAAKACLKYKVVFNNSLGEWYADWSRLGSEYTLVGLTSGALDDHPKWDPIARTVRQSTTNALLRADGGSGSEVSSDIALQAFSLCEEIGVDLSK